jgi:phage terminase large subunit-like protein
MGRFDPAYNRSDLSIHLPNGSVIYSYSGESPERSRGPNLAGAWLDELGSWRYRETWDTMAPALRRADAKVVITTTPRAVPLVKEFYHRDGDGSVIVTKGSMDENASNLSQGTLDDLRLRWAGTRWGRQELGGELIEVIEGALWDPDNIASNRVPRPEGSDGDPFGIQELYERIEPTRIVIAVDPALSFTENSDEHGIIVAAKGADGHVYILEDLSRRCPVTAWPEIVIEAHARWQVDRVVAEQNAGYDYIGVQLKAAGYRGGYEKVNARRGKLLRAAPVATYYEQNKVHHVGEFPQLESQMCVFVPDEMSDAPGVDDRVDAMVYAVAWLEPRLISGWGHVYTPFTDEEKAEMTVGRSNWARVYAPPDKPETNGNGGPAKPKGGYFG